MPVWTLAFDEGLCETTTYQLVTDDPASQARGQDLEELFRTNSQRDLPLPACPADTQTNGEEFLQRIRRVVSRRVPTPTPTIQPGEAITGLPSYLQTGRPLTETFDIPVTAGGLSTTVHIQATGSYRVDWGDGTTTGPHHLPGRPWPDGTITHTYQTEGTVDVTIHDTWQVQVTVPNLLEDQLTLQPPATVLDDFPVNEVETARIDVD